MQNGAAGGNAILQPEGFAKCFANALMHFLAFAVSPSLIFVFASVLFTTDSEQCCCAWDDALEGTSVSSILY